MAAEQHIGHYKMGEVLGKGAFGTVYRALNVTNGHVVAVKRMDILNMPKEELASIESEINLLRGLDHPNIVRYIDTIRTKTQLNIILEYIENGSLTAIVKNFGGRFPESLVALYISQLLKGLEYLHTEGVIHRDIKGANVLATKDGVMKLADFGVATHFSESNKSDSVVGTPYQMAPEIIEMSRQTTQACDIWSVGCTTIEILTGAPPYFNLQPMSALFRIVQDEHPPIPPGVSPALNDFLLQCFQKDPNLRINAVNLLKHPQLRTNTAAHEQNSKFASNIDPNYENVEMIQNTIKISAKQLEKVEAKNLYGSSTNSNRILVNNKANTVNYEQSLASNNFTKIEKFAENSDDDFEDSDFIDDNYSNTIKINGSQFISNNNQTEYDLNDSNLSAVKDLRNGKLKEYFDSEDEDLDLDENSDIDIHAVEKINATSTQINDDLEDGNFSDVFSDTAFDELDTQSNEKARMSAEVLSLISNLTTKQLPDMIISTCNRLLKIFEEDQSQISSVMSIHGVIPVIEMMEISENDVLSAILGVLNKIIQANPKFFQTLCMVGLIPSVCKLVSNKYPLKIRKEAGVLIKKFCSSDSNSKDYIRKMFIACGGLSALVQFLIGYYEKSRELMATGIDCIFLIFDTPNHPKNDFCRLFTKFGILRPLVILLRNSFKDCEQKDATYYSRKVAHLFSIFSECDTTIKNAISQPEILKCLLILLPQLEPDVLIHIVKAIRNLSMDVTTIDLLEECSVIPKLIPFLASPFPDIQNQVIQAMFYIIQIKTSRQEQAAKFGIIPHLQNLILKNHPLKEFAFPMICKLAHAGPRALHELKKYNGIKFYLDLLDQHHQQLFALDSIATQIANDCSRVEIVLLQKNNLCKLVNVFRLTEKNIFDSVLISITKIAIISQKCGKYFGSSDAFIAEIIERLRVLSSAHQCYPILKLVSILFQQHLHRKDFNLKQFCLKLYSTIEQFAGNKKILVRGIALELFNNFKGVLK